MRRVKCSQGLVGYWPLNEGGGTTAFDISGNGNNGSLVNSPACISSPAGNVLSFNGSNQYVNLGTPANLTPLQVNISILASVMVRSGSFGSIFTQYSGLTSSNLIKLFGFSSTEFSYYTSKSDGTYQRFSYSTVPSLNVYHRLAVTISGTLAAPIITIYCDGIGQSFSGLALSTTPNLTVPITIGCDNSGGSQNEFINGAIGNVQIYNRALSAQEIAQDYINQNSIYVKRASLLSMIAGLTSNFNAIYGTTYMSQQQSGLISTNTNIAAALAAAQNGSGLIAASASIAGALSIGFASIAQESVAQSISGIGNVTQLSSGNITVTSPLLSYIAGLTNYSAGVLGTLTSSMSIASAAKMGTLSAAGIMSALNIVGVAGYDSGVAISKPSAINSLLGFGNLSNGFSSFCVTSGNLSAIANYCVASHAAITAQATTIYYGKLGLIDLTQQYGIQVLN